MGDDERGVVPPPTPCGFPSASDIPDGISPGATGDPPPPGVPAGSGQGAGSPQCSPQPIPSNGPDPLPVKHHSPLWNSLRDKGKANEPGEQREQTSTRSGTSTSQKHVGKDLQTSPFHHSVYLGDETSSQISFSPFRNRGSQLNFTEPRCFLRNYSEV